MAPPPVLHRFRLAGIAPLAFLLIASVAPASPAKWAGDIDALTCHDTTQPPPAHGIVFVGSSSIRLWDSLASDFPGLPVIGRGFGGSELADSIHYLDRLVLPYRPRTVVLYAGENDLAAGKSPETVAADFIDFCARLHAAQPAVRIIYLAMKPSPSRWTLHERFEQGNALIAAACERDRRLTFVDVYHAMLDADGQPRADLFREDRLHMNPAGYAVWIRLLTPLLKQ